MIKYKLTANYRIFLSSTKVLVTHKINYMYIHEMYIYIYRYIFVNGFVKNFENSTCTLYFDILHDARMRYKTMISSYVDNLE